MKKLIILILSISLIAINTIKSQEVDNVELDVFIKKVTQGIKLEYFQLNKEEQKIFINYLNTCNKFFKGSIFLRNEALQTMWAKQSGLVCIKEIMDINPKFQKINSIYSESINSIVLYEKNLMSFNKTIIKFNNFIITELEELKLPILSKL